MTRPRKASVLLTRLRRRWKVARVLRPFSVVFRIFFLEGGVHLFRTYVEWNRQFPRKLPRPAERPSETDCLQRCQRRYARLQDTGRGLSNGVSEFVTGRAGTRHRSYGAEDEQRRQQCEHGPRSPVAFGKS